MMLLGKNIWHDFFRVLETKTGFIPGCRPGCRLWNQVWNQVWNQGLCYKERFQSRFFQWFTLFQALGVKRKLAKCFKKRRFVNGSSLGSQKKLNIKINEINGFETILDCSSLGSQAKMDTTINKQTSISKGSWILQASGAKRNGYKNQ